MRVFAVLALVATAAFFFCPTMDADGQLLKKRRPVDLATCPTATGLCVESPMDASPAPLPSLPVTTMEPSSSPVQVIALEPVPGTGSKSPTGLLKPTVIHTLDADAIKKLADLVAIARPKPEACITHRLDAETSPQLSRVGSSLEWLLMLATAVLGISGADRAWPWVAPVVRGLQRFVAGMSSDPPKTLAESSSTPIKP